MKKDNKGFSLIEVIVALVLLTIVFASLMQLLDATAKLQQRTKQRENMSAISLSIYETFLLDGDETNFMTNLGFIYGEDKVVNEDSVFTIYFNGSWIPSNSANYKYKAIINLITGTSVGTTEDYELLTVECQVSFNDKDGLLLLQKDKVPTYILRRHNND